MELFGRRPDMSKNTGLDNLPQPFMCIRCRPGIEEVSSSTCSKNYYATSRLSGSRTNGKEDGRQGGRAQPRLVKGIMRWVRLHPTNRPKVPGRRRALPRKRCARCGKAGKSNGRVASRLEAVRWQTAIQQYIRSDNGWGIQIRDAGSVIGRNQRR